MTGVLQIAVLLPMEAISLRIPSEHSEQGSQRVKARRTAWEEGAVFPGKTEPQGLSTGRNGPRRVTRVRHGE
ncbi:MAG: hypothetical protein GX443_11885 [Deltaproteobacteria bacterium]|nr:hypothetical protein [Deltaproteobacteria bacterium]